MLDTRNRRGYKAFSIYKNHFSLERPIIVEVPIDNYVRRATGRLPTPPCSAATGI